MLPARQSVLVRGAHTSRQRIRLCCVCWQVVRWHRGLDTVPQDLPTIFLAHEFFDALPAHLFRKAGNVWRVGHPD